MSKRPYNDSLVAFLRGSWARGKVVRNWGGNFWGPSRKRCSILPPEVLKALQEDGVIDLQGTTFTVKGDANG